MIVTAMLVTVYMQVYLHIPIYVQVAHNFDTF